MKTAFIWTEKESDLNGDQWSYFSHDHILSTGFKAEIWQKLNKIYSWSRRPQWQRHRYGYSNCVDVMFPVIKAQKHTIIIAKKIKMIKLQRASKHQ